MLQRAVRSLTHGRACGSLTMGARPLSFAANTNLMLPKGTFDGKIALVTVRAEKSSMGDSNASKINN